LTVRGREEEMSQLFEKIGTKRVTWPGENSRWWTW
jgi:hypothetical protein